MLYSDDFVTQDGLRYLYFKALHPLGDTTDYIRWLNANGRLTEDELAVKTSFAQLRTQGRNLDRGEQVYAQAVAAGMGADPTVMDLRAQLDHAEEVYTTTANAAQAAIDMAGGQLEIDTNAGLEGFGDWGIVLTGLALVAAAVVCVLFLPEAAIAAALVAAVAVVIATTGAVLTLLGAAGAGSAGTKVAGFGIAALVGLGILALVGSKRSG